MKRFTPAAMLLFMLGAAGCTKPDADKKDEVAVPVEVAAASSGAIAAAWRGTATWRWLGWLAAVVALLAIFSFYTHPDFMVDMADKLWACF